MLNLILPNGKKEQWIFAVCLIHTIDCPKLQNSWDNFLVIRFCTISDKYQILDVLNFEWHFNKFLLSTRATLCPLGGVGEMFTFLFIHFFHFLRFLLNYFNSFNDFLFSAVSSCLLRTSYPGPCFFALFCCVCFIILLDQSLI